MNIFYADDDEDDREIFCIAIQQINPSIKVTFSRDGQEALKILNAQSILPDFIFLDVNMPKMNGAECLIELKSDHRLKNIPVVMYSTTSDTNEINKLIQLGAKDFIVKVPSFEKLRDSIHKVLTKEHSAVKR
jgi:CheY-like chemotaxis protein